MSAYWPADINLIDRVGLLLLATVLVGLAVSRLRSRGFAWLQVVFFPVVIERMTADAPAGFRMVALCLALWLTFKVVVSVEASRAGDPLPGPLAWLGFATLWFGMRPAVFAARPRPRPDAAALVARGSLFFLAGLAGLYLAHALWLLTPSWNATARLTLATAVALISFSLLLHFGLINMAAGIWRAVGYDCRPLWHAPLESRSLTEFWGKRWNRAFTELLTLAIYRPLQPVVGRPMATLGAFLFSGLLHEVAISVPVRAGYGLPTLYFLLHGLLVLVERRWPLTGWPARVWTLAWLALPLPMLFHPWFLAGTVWPLLGIDPCSRG